MSLKSTLPHVLQNEGGYVNDPTDRGGETYRGISRIHNPNWEGWYLVDEAKATVGTSPNAVNRYLGTLPEMDRALEDIYGKNYYAPVAALKAPERVVDKLFDAGVNIGPVKAIRLAQAILGVDVDGKIGPATLRAVGEYFRQPADVDKFINAFCRAQLGYYQAIIARNPSQQKYINGWTKRANWRP